MKQGVLKLEQCGADCYHTVFKTQHGRLIYLALRTAYKTQYRITDCCYIDRTKSYTPKKLKTFCFKQEQLLTTIAEELDRR